MNTNDIIIPSILASAVMCLAFGSASATQFRTLEGDEWCEREGDYDSRRAVYCEVREASLSARDVVRVDAGANGGVSVTGWNRSEILVRTKVVAWARSEEDAREIASQVSIDTEGRTIRARGPRTRRREHWVVSYQLSVPHESNLSLETTNGGINIAHVSGQVEFEAVNGGVHLSGVSGTVRGRTTNGGVHIELEGPRWEGEGLDVRTTNGGVTISVPEDYSAHLETGTQNGGLRLDFPIMVQGRIDRILSTDLGDGGATIRAVTTNGGVTVRRK